MLLFTVPGLAYDARKMVRTATGSHVQYVLTADDARALAWVDAHQPPGGILAPTPFASVVPSRTGLPVYVGHGYWSRDYVSRAREVDRLFDGRLRPDAARALVTRTGAALLISDCAHPRPLSRALGPMIAFTQRFGCARVYLLAASRPHHAARAATSAMTRESWLPCQATGERPGASSTSCAPGMAAA